MRIGISGTMSVGKSTLVKALSELPEFKDYYVATERSKYLNDLGIPLNNDSTVRGQMVFMAERASELIKDNLITDRTIYDVCAFTFSSKEIPWGDKVKLAEAGLLLREYYDVIFYIDPIGTVIEDNGVRTTDPEYRDKINFAIVEILKNYPPKKLITIQGTTEERVAAILPHLK